MFYVHFDTKYSISETFSKPAWYGKTMFHLYDGCYTRNFHFHCNTELAWHRNTTI